MITLVRCYEITAEADDDDAEDAGIDADDDDASSI